MRSCTHIVDLVFHAVAMENDVGMMIVSCLRKNDGVANAISSVSVPIANI